MTLARELVSRFFGDGYIDIAGFGFLLCSEAKNDIMGNLHSSKTITAKHS